MLNTPPQSASRVVFDPDAPLTDASLLTAIPTEVVNKYQVFPMRLAGERLTVAMADPSDLQTVEELSVITGYTIERVKASGTSISKAISKHFGSHVSRMLEDMDGGRSDPESTTGEEDSGELAPARLYELAREPSLVNLVNLILFEAIDLQASDIHIEPFEKNLKTRYRVDGVLVERAPTPKNLHPAIISRIKILAQMDIAERFVPQDGHIEFPSHKGKVDIRVSTIPTVFGESVVMRLLDRSSSIGSFEELGMDPVTLGNFNKCLTKAHGIVLVTGPTGSGKTTTLYHALKQIFTPELKIITIEDPVEYQLDGIVQMPVNTRRGLSFANGLRHILRQDPDVVMVGEIRDSETADIAVRAALTGHLVFSTLHTNNAAGAITRLIDMGVEPFLLASSLIAVLAQRLVRRICPSCKVPLAPDPALLAGFGDCELPENATFYHGTGCEECLNSGLRGRLGIFELLRVNEALRGAIGKKPSIDAIHKRASADHIFMREDGVRKVLDGQTILEEVLRVTQD